MAYYSHAAGIITNIEHLNTPSDDCTLLLTLEGEYPEGPFQIQINPDEQPPGALAGGVLGWFCAACKQTDANDQHAQPAPFPHSAHRLWEKICEKARLDAKKSRSFFRKPGANKWRAAAIPGKRKNRQTAVFAVKA